MSMTPSFGAKSLKILPLHYHNMRSVSPDGKKRIRDSLNFTTFYFYYHISFEKRIHVKTSISNENFDSLLLRDQFRLKIIMLFHLGMVSRRISPGVFVGGFCPGTVFVGKIILLLIRYKF